MRKTIKQLLNSKSNKFKFLTNKFFFRKISPFIISQDQIPPNGFYDGIENFRENYLNNSKYTELFPETTIKLSEPVHLEEQINEIFLKTEKYIPADYILEIPDGRVYGQDGIVITPDNKMLDDVNYLYNLYTKDSFKHEVFTRFKMPKPQVINAQVAVMSTFGSNCYYHWMFDVLPKFKLLIDADITPDFYVLNYEMKKFQVDSLKKLGITEQKIVTTHKDMHIKADSLIIPSMPGYTESKLWGVEFLKNLFFENKLEKNFNKKIFINRRNTFSRRIINEEEVQNYLKDNEIEEVFLEDYDLNEQANIISNAELVIAIHGSGLTNLIFARENTKVIEIFPPHMMVDCYWILCNLLGLKNHQLICKSPKGKIKVNNKKYNHTDIYIDMNKLEELIKLSVTTQVP